MIWRRNTKMNKETIPETIDLAACFSRVQATCPLVHHITNYVTVNDCANMTLAVGASPVMADDPAEVADMCGIAQALVLNIGTLNARTVEAMLLAGRAANAREIPVVLDPVGCGATPLREETVRKILAEIKIAVIRGNVSEIAAVSGKDAHTKGVDAAAEDASADTAALARSVSEVYHCVTAVSGAVDIVTDGRRVAAVRNGCPRMSRITGTGCMETSVLGAFCGANPGNLWQAASAGMIFMGLCGDIAEKVAGAVGLGSFRNAILDAAGNMTPDMLAKGAKYDAWEV